MTNSTTTLPPKKNHVYCRPWNVTMFMMLLFSIVFNIALRPGSVYVLQEAAIDADTQAPSDIKSHIHVLANQRIFMVILSYDHSQAVFLHRLLESVRSICETGASIDIVILTSVPWSVEWIQRTQSIMQCRYHGQNREVNTISLEVQLYTPKRGKRLVHIHRDLFYKRLLNNNDRNSNETVNVNSKDPQYTLFVYTEEDHLIGPRQVAAYLDETDKLQTLLVQHHQQSGPKFSDYSIGFLRFEWEIFDRKNNPNRFPNQMIWEHRWNISSPAAFLEHHLIPIQNSKGQTEYYFAPKGTHHQGMFMATPKQLQEWKDRPPNCQFHNSSLTVRSQGREHSSSLHLYSPKGCNVTQIFPLNSTFHDLLIHHMPNQQYPTLHKFVPKHKRIETITAQQLASVVLDASKMLSIDSTKQIVFMADAESSSKYDDEQPPPDISDYKKYVQRYFSEVQK